MCVAPCFGGSRDGDDSSQSELSTGKFVFVVGVLNLRNLDGIRKVFGLVASVIDSIDLLLLVRPRVRRDALIVRDCVSSLWLRNQAGIWFSVFVIALVCRCRGFYARHNGLR